MERTIVTPPPPTRVTAPPPRRRARLEIVGEAIVKPGSAATMMPDVIHSIAVAGREPTLHLHMYGLSMDYPGNRTGFDLQAGTCAPYRSMSRTVR